MRELPLPRFPLRAIIQVALCAAAAHAGFDFGTGCAGGSGTFNVELAEGSTATLGTIPAGKRDVKIFLSSDADLDVQLYDLEDVARFPEGLAVIAWCDTSADAGCNIGKLGSDEGVARTTYHGMGVEYSGYGGVGGAAGLRCTPGCADSVGLAPGVSFCEEKTRGKRTRCGRRCKRCGR